jgi:acyl-CoA synthetase (NDP forming)
MGAVVQDRAPYGKVYRGYIEYMQRGHAASGKPVALVAARQGTGYDDIAVTSTAEGFPVLDGVPAFLRGVRALFDYRDFLARDDGALPNVSASGSPVESGEAAALQLLADYGLPVVPVTLIYKESDAAASEFPVVLKTGAPGIAHKTDAGGVVLNIESEEALRDAYRDLSKRLGPEALIAPMVREGVEMLLGIRTDPQFGPVVLIGFGGVYAETLKDVTFALPPFTAAHARRCIDRLRLRPMLDGQRGKPPADIDAFCDTAARFSAMVHELQDEIREIDINPIIVHEAGCTIVDALVVT